MAIHDVKITVVKKVSNPEVFQRYADRGAHPSCETVEAGMEFVSQGMAMPHQLLQLGLGSTSRGTWLTLRWAATSRG